jgi:hypothetical protein
MNFMVVTRAEVDSHRRFGVCTFNSRTREVSLRPSVQGARECARSEYRVATDMNVGNSI